MKIIIIIINIISIINSINYFPPDAGDMIGYIEDMSVRDSVSMTMGTEVA